MLKALDIMKVSPIIPVVSIEKASSALPLAEALFEGGIGIMEITLRTPQALEAIEIVSKQMPSMCVGAGTVLNESQFAQVQERGASFVISPGMTQSLLEYSSKSEVPFIPGVATASDIMQGLEYDLNAFKLFPANIVGGPKAIASFKGPFKDVLFCPTGGINLNNAAEYLNLENVLCVGGTWVSPSSLLKAGDYKQISRICKSSLEHITEGKSHE